MEKDASIFLTGHRGMVGQAVLNHLLSLGYSNLLTATHKELNLINQQAVQEFFKTNQPQYVIHIAARVGGIKDNTSFPADFGYENGMMELNVIHAAKEYNVKKLLFLGSSCIYPKESLQPIKEEYLLSGKLEPTNELYGLAKIFGIKLCEAYNQQYNTHFISCIPCNLYGTGDRFDPLYGHVLSSIMMKIDNAKQNHLPFVTLWGDGSPKREFLHVEDLAEACVFLMNEYKGSKPLNVGSGSDISIKDLASLVKKTVNYKGEIRFDPSYPNGMKRKLMDSTSLFNLGWQPKISLEEGVSQTYNWYKKNEPTLSISK